jgi:hypothetical protein
MNSSGDFPSRFQVWTISACLITILSFFALVWFTWQTQTTAVERMYLGLYVNSWRQSQSISRTARYSIPAIVNLRRDWRIAADGEVESVTTADGRQSYALTEAATARGNFKLETLDMTLNSQQLHAQLAHYIYQDQTVWDFIQRPAYGALIVFIYGLLVAVPKDSARARVRRYGRVVDGPELVSAAEFNSRTPSDGVGFDHIEPGWFSRLHRQSVMQVRIPREMERYHIMIVGDTGSGKSALFRQLLMQIRARGEAAIVYDPAMEYLPQFYDARRGDTILNPLDARAPYWSPAFEIEDEAEALTVATSMFPEQSEHNRFFSDASRRLFAHLVNLKPAPETLIHWMCHVKEIDQRVKGTELEAMIDPHAGPQRAGVLGSLNMAASALKLLPGEKETRQRWSALEWSKHRKGWIFITAPATAKERVQPLVTMWLDLLMLRLMNEGHTDKPPIWFALDEAADLQHVPQLAKAITQNRKSNNPMVLGFQGKDQVEMFYGRLAKTVLSQPSTRIYLKTGEPDAAEWIERAIGMVSVEHLRETWSTGADGRNQLSETIDPPRSEPLISYSKIAGLSRLQGYMKHGNLVVQLSTRYIQLPHCSEKFIKRTPCAEPNEEVVPNVGSAVPGSVPQNSQGLFFE